MHNEFIYLSTICLGLIIISWIFCLIVRLTLSPWTSRLPTWIGWMLRIVSLTTYSGSVYTWVFSFCPVGPSWSWSYGNWIYNYIWNQFLLPLTLWVRIPPRVRCTRFISDLQQVGGLLRMFSVTCSRSVVFCGCSSFIQQKSPYNRNTVESGLNTTILTPSKLFYIVYDIWWTLTITRWVPCSEQ